MQKKTCKRTNVSNKIRNEQVKQKRAREHHYEEAKHYERASKGNSKNKRAQHNEQSKVGEHNTEHTPHDYKSCLLYTSPSPRD